MTDSEPQPEQLHAKPEMPEELPAVAPVETPTVKIETKKPKNPKRVEAGHRLAEWNRKKKAAVVPIPVAKVNKAVDQPSTLMGFQSEIWLFGALVIAIIAWANSRSSESDPPPIKLSPTEATHGVNLQDQSDQVEDHVEPDPFQME